MVFALISQLLMTIYTQVAIFHNWTTLNKGQNLNYGECNFDIILDY